MPQVGEIIVKPCGCQERIDAVFGEVFGSSRILECQSCAVARAADANASLVRQQIDDIKQQLNALDISAIRPLLGGETARLSEINSQKVALRAQLQALEGGA